MMAHGSSLPGEIGSACGAAVGAWTSIERCRLARRDSDRQNQLVVPMRRHRLAHELQEIRCEQRIARQVRHPEWPTFDDRDCVEPDVEELLQQHWLRQCSSQSTRDRCRALQHVFRQRFGQHEIRNHQTSTGAEDTEGLGQHTALSGRQIQHAV